jgi:hypothetical protein
VYPRLAQVLGWHGTGGVTEQDARSQMRYSSAFSWALMGVGVHSAGNASFVSSAVVLGPVGVSTRLT